MVTQLTFRSSLNNWKYFGFGVPKYNLVALRVLYMTTVVHRFTKNLGHILKF